MSKSIPVPNKTGILIVDGDPNLCEALGFCLSQEGFTVDSVPSADRALKRELTKYDLIIVDADLKGMDGIEFVKTLRGEFTTSNIPVAICTARNSDEAIIEGLEVGADLYITRPTSLKVMIARIKALLRRTKGRASRRVLTYGALEVDLEAKKVLLEGQLVKMPRKEYEILSLLLSNPGRVFTREEILRQIWSQHSVELDRVVDVNITRLRAKIGTYGRNIITRSGYGYGFEG